MREFNHPNIVKLIGVAAFREPILIVMEFCDAGSLLKKLQQKGKKMKPESRIRYCHEAAKGMEYLEKNNCMHRDVASRNCLLGSKGEVKIADFGMSHTTDIYRITTQKKLPLKWLSPETMKTKTFNMKTDIWSFGILLWEVYANGDDPYPDIAINKIQKERLFETHHKLDNFIQNNMFFVNKKVCAGYRMKPPEGTPQEVADLMDNCWKKENERPSFKKIAKVLSEVTKKYKP